MSGAWHGCEFEDMLRVLDDRGLRGWPPELAEAELGVAG